MKRPQQSTSANAMTVDVEDYYQVAAFEDVVERDSWRHRESRVRRNTNRILALFDDAGIDATFFVLGWVAEHHPEIVADIVSAGHEIGSHGYSHRLIYDQTPEEFRSETERSRKLLQDLSHQQVNGYRAASYSITRRSLWALDVIADVGFTYDSSIFPIVHDRYGMIGGPTGVHTLELKDRELKEFPLNFAQVGKVRLPISGGGYFRLYPYALTRSLLERCSGNGPFVFYIHPWEIDPDQPRLPGRLLSRFRHYNNLGRCEARLRQLLQDFRFTGMERVIRSTSHDGRRFAVSGYEKDVA